MAGSGFACCEPAAAKIACEVEIGGRVSSHQGLNLPGADVAAAVSEPEDLAWVDFAVEEGIDLLAVSFVRRAEDLLPVERRLRVAGADIPLIAKIEKPQAAENAEAIIDAAFGGIMVARGDLGIELPLARVPIVQRRLLALAGQHSKPSITATQMLASMVSSPRPTRAEVTDVANAIWQGTDAVMLSEETAVGEYPVEAVRVMDRIAREAEPELPYGDWVFNRADRRPERRRQLGRSGGGRLDLHAGPRRARGPDAKRTDRAAGLRAPPAGAGARRLAANRDRPAAEPAVRRGVRHRRGLDEPARAALRLRAAGQDAGVAAVRRADRDHRRPTPAGAGHEHVRGPPRAVAARKAWIEAAAASSRGCPRLRSELAVR